MKKPEITYEDDDGIITFLVDGVEIDTWTYDIGSPEDQLSVFKKVFEAGFKEAVEYFGGHLIDEHESKFEGGEVEIAVICKKVLELFKPK